MAWLGEEYARAGATGVVVFDGGAGERRLVERWLAGSQLGVEGVAEEARSPLHAAADLASDRPDRLAVSLRTKGRILLDGPLPALHPLGDLWGFELAAWGVEARAPTGFDDPDEWERVERALAEGLDGGRGLRRALSVLGPDRADAVEERVTRTAATTRVRLPKLGWWTIGVDPPLG